MTPCWRACVCAASFSPATEFLRLLAPIVQGDAHARHTARTEHYAADEVPSTPGAVQGAVPLTVAAGGLKGMRLVTRYARQWVTIGPTGGS